jgi:hypothetical protein
MTGVWADAPRPPLTPCIGPVFEYAELIAKDALVANTQKDDTSVVNMAIGAGVFAAAICHHQIKLGVKAVVIGIVPVRFLVHSKNLITEVGSHFPKLPPMPFPQKDLCQSFEAGRA